jgi:hypothetical protein
VRPGLPRWEQINDSPYPHEQAGLDLLRDYLPDANPYHVWANVEFVGTDGSINEIDALVLTPAGLYLIELKHWEGQVSGNGTQWIRRSRFGARGGVGHPLIATNRKARRLGALLRFYARRGEQVPRVHAAVFLHARSSRSALDPVGRQHIYGLHGSDRFSGLPSLRDFLTRPSSVIDGSTGRRVPAEFTVYFGRQELGRIDPSLLTEEVAGERRLLLTGRSWAVTYIDWKRRRCFVAPADGGGKAAALPPRLAEATLAARSVDLAGATAILGEPVRFVIEH